MTEEISPSVGGEEVKVEEAKVEEKASRKCLIAGICRKYCANCKGNGVRIAIAVLIVLVAATYGIKVYREKTDAAQTESIKTKIQKFVDANVQPGTKASIKDISKENNLYKVTITVGAQDIVTYASTDGKKLFSGVADLDPKTDAPANQQAAAPEQKEIPKTDKPNVDLYVMAFCPFGNKAEDTLKPVYDLLKNKVNFNFHYIVTTQGSDVQSLHGPKEVTEDEKEACVLKTYGKDKWMAIATYVNTNCGSDGTCFDGGAKTLGINSATVNACVASQGLALMKDNEKASNAANATGSPTLMINGVSATGVYQYGNSDAYKKQICDAFKTAPAECAKALSTATTTAQGGSCNTQ